MPSVLLSFGEEVVMWQATDEFDGYFLWLGDLVEVDWDRYSELLYALHLMDFTWCLEQDESRSTEGLMLREEYYELSGREEDWVMLLDRPCTVLEALIPIAKRMDDILVDEDTGDRTRIWFWEFIGNLGLKKYTNQRLIGRFKTDDDYDIQMIVRTWLDREFQYDGKGSLFPLKEPSCDQRSRSIVYQMYDYAFENYWVE